MKHLLVIIICLLCVGNAFAQRSKMSPFVRQAAMEGIVDGNASMSKGLLTQQKRCLTAFVQTTDKSVFGRHGCRILAQWDDIYIAAIPLTEIDALAAEEQVSCIEAGKSGSLTTDSTATITHVRDVWSNPIHAGGFTGKDVVVGVMDVGFDLTNPTYYSSDGKTYRVKRMWDMLDYTDGGEAVTGQAIPNGYFIGRQYIGYDSLMRKQHSTDGLIQYHGAHTSATVAGSGWDGTPASSRYSGMAPDADICLVSNWVSEDDDLVAPGDEYKFTTATDMLGFKYIFDYADSVGKPCVISFSEGTYEDLYNSGIYNKVVSKMVGPGHILCSSAGNEGARGTYIHKEQGDSLKGAFLKADDITALYVLRSTQPPVVTLRFYGSGEVIKEWRYDTENLRDYPDSLYMDTVVINERKYLVALETYASCYDENLFATDLFFIDLQGSNIGTYPASLVLTGKDNDVEAIANGGYFTGNSLDSSLRDFVYTHGILMPGCFDDVICVGNVGYRKSFVNIDGINIIFGNDGGRIYHNSSHGPSMKGNVKPDVVAPGVNIISSLNHFCELYPSYIKVHFVSNFDYNGSTYNYGAMTGTSMSTPVTAGIVALWLQACPTLSPDDVSDVIAHTSSHFAEMTSWPNNTYGYGEIDAKAGLDYILKTHFAASDVNKDKNTDVLDVNAVISDICGDNTYSSFADVNGDGNVDIVDVNVVISVICGEK